MPRQIIIPIVFLLILPMKIVGITPVHIGEFDIDTSLYSHQPNCREFIVPGPITRGMEGINVDESKGVMIINVLQKKNSDQFDLYAFGGKIGTSIVPVIKKNEYYQFDILFSCTMLDEDAGWETIVNCFDENNKVFFKVFDEDGTEVLADSGRAYYGVDLNNTYVIARRIGKVSYHYDTWRFRTNISGESPKSLAKTKSTQTSPMQIYGLPGGDYHVTLTPSSGNQINFQMFDLLGRCVFDKQIENLNRPVSFTVPEGNVPNSPFIAKVNDGNNTIVKKQIPVK